MEKDLIQQIFDAKLEKISNPNESIYFDLVSECLNPFTILNIKGILSEYFSNVDFVFSVRSVTNFKSSIRVYTTPRKFVYVYCCETSSQTFVRKIGKTSQKKFREIVNKFLQINSYSNFIIIKKDGDVIGKLNYDGWETCKNLF